MEQLLDSGAWEVTVFDIRAVEGEARARYVVGDLRDAAQVADACQGARACGARGRPRLRLRLRLRLALLVPHAQAPRNPWPGMRASVSGTRLFQPTAAAPSGPAAPPAEASIPPPTPHSMQARTWSFTWPPLRPQAPTRRTAR